MNSQLRLLLLSFLLTFSTFLSIAQTWKNPLILTNEWSLYGIGDPYILKFNGTYYLYCSTRDSETGVKCWSSKDLQTWKYEGLCSTDAITKCAYAPEVIYYNGKFYMYTSPSGNGHYILQSNNPTGPFVTVTGNLGHSIDGSVYKSDAGQLYFYHAGGDGIHSHTMSSPTNIGSDNVLGSTQMNGWTEGPCVIKRNGKYYMIYTGNHVISKGYRINLAVSNSPATSYVSQDNQNPVILSTEGSQIGLGHGSLLSGPDLDSYYIVYHNFAGDYGVGPFRHFNFDRIGFNGSKMIVMGPTSTNQVVPDLPDFSDYFEGTTLAPEWTITPNATWTVNGSTLNLTPTDLNSDQAHIALAPGQTGDYFTAEFNAWRTGNAGTGSSFGVVYNYTDNQNYGVAVFNAESNRLELKTQTNGVWSTSSYFSLPGVTDYSKSHCIRIEREGTKLNFYVDGMMKKSMTIEQTSGRIGYYAYKTSATFGPAAYSRKVNGSGIFNNYKPVPGIIDASLYRSEGEGLSYHDLTPTNTELTTFRTDAVENVLNTTGDYYVSSEKGEWLKYAVMVKSTTNYKIGLKYASATASKIRLSQVGSTKSVEIDLPATGGATNWRTKIIENLPLVKGQQDLLLEVLDGSIQLYTMRFVEDPTKTLPILESFDGISTFGSNWTYNDGTWTFSNQEIASNGFGKCLIGSTFANYTVSVNVKYEKNMNAGLLIRASNPSMGGSGQDVQAGADFVQAYFVTMGENGCTLGKHNYNWSQLATSIGSYTTGKWYKMTVKVEDDNIQLFIDDSKTPVIDYTDPEPFIAGKAGFRSFDCTAHFDNLEIRALESASNLKTAKKAAISFYPNPADQNVFMDFPIPTQKGGVLELFTPSGKLVYQSNLPENVQQFSIPVATLNPGLFLIKYSDRGQSYAGKLQIR